MQNFVFYLGPLLPFSVFFKIIDKFCLLKKIFFHLQNLEHCRAKQTLFRNVGFKINKKQAVTFALFSTFLNPQKDTLNYGAVSQSVSDKGKQ